MIGAVKKHSEDKGLYLNVKKTKIMDNSVCKRPTDITVGGEVIEQVDSFEYLGSLIDNKADITSEIKRLASLTVNWDSLTNYGQDRMLPPSCVC